MEDVYLTKQFNSAVSENVSFADFFNQYSISVNYGLFRDQNNKAVISKLLELKHLAYAKYMKICNPHLLCVKSQSSVKYKEPVKGFRKGFHNYEIPDGECSLKSLQALKNRTDTEKFQYRKFLKYPGQIVLDPGEDDSATKNIGSLIPYNEFILTVRIYIPWKHRTASNGINRVPQVSQEFLIAGNMTLDKLRDRIGCPEDFQDICPDISENPLQSITTRSGDVYKSAMFYIGNIFYVDTRHVSNIDYSEVIKKWGVRRKLSLHRTESMEQTQVNSLVARLGYPYVYVHQGCCEHLLVITDARLMHGLDIKILDDYPIMTSFAALKGKFCNLCAQRQAKFIIFGSPDLPYDTSFLCTTCTFLYNYNGYTKNNNFKLVKYIDRLAVL